jgi:hypothetical protein
VFLLSNTQDILWLLKSLVFMSFEHHCSSLRKRFAAFAGDGRLFLTGSVGTVIGSLPLSSPNQELVVAGGVALSIGALMAIKRRFHLMPPILLLANGLLAVNGLQIASSAGGDSSVMIGGALLTSANSIFGYGVANLRMLKGEIAPDAHGALSILAGTQIGMAGAAFADPVLAAVGIIFATDGLARSMSEGRSLKAVAADAFRSLPGAKLLSRNASPADRNRKAPKPSQT